MDRFNALLRLYDEFATNLRCPRGVPTGCAVNGDAIQGLGLTMLKSGTRYEMSNRCFFRRFVVLATFALGLLLAASAHAAPGDPDLLFGNNGRVADLFSAVTNSRPDGTLIQPDGKIVVAGGCGSTTEVICVARRLPTGAPDPDFGTQGTVVTTEQISNAGDAIKIVSQRDGKLVIAATCNSILFCAIRLNSNGTRDSTFGTNGKVTSSAMASWCLLVTAIRPRIVWHVLTRTD
jgi:uncharacterized delta-60 repeat protein